MNEFMKNEDNEQRKLFQNKKMNALLIVIGAVFVLAVVGTVIWLNVA